MAIKMADIVARVTSQTQYSSLLAGDQFGFKSAKQYGAVGDGVTDDSAAILSLISAVSSSTSKSLYFPTGVYKVDNVTLTSTHFSGYYLFGDNASFSGITKDIDQVGQTVGKLSDLNTTDKDSIVDAINELQSGSFASYITTGTQNQYLVVSSTSAKTLEAKDSPQKVLTNQGDVLYASAPNTIGRVGIGTNLQNLSVNATTDGLIYQDSVQKIMTAQGDMIYASSANNPVRLAKGSAGKALVMNATTTAPEWGDGIQSLITAAGDIVYGSSSNVPAKLPLGSVKKALVSNGTNLEYNYVFLPYISPSSNTIISSTGEKTTSAAANATYGKFKISNLNGDTLHEIIELTSYSVMYATFSTDLESKKWPGYYDRIKFSASGCSLSTAPYELLKEIQVVIPGKYRISVDLKVNGYASAAATVSIKNVSIKGDITAPTTSASVILA